MPAGRGQRHVVPPLTGHRARGWVQGLSGGSFVGRIETVAVTCRACHHMPCHAMPCDAMQWHATTCHAVLNAASCQATACLSTPPSPSPRPQACKRAAEGRAQQCARLPVQAGRLWAEQVGWGGASMMHGHGMAVCTCMARPCHRAMSALGALWCSTPPPCTRPLPDLISPSSSPARTGCWTGAPPTCRPAAWAPPPTPPQSCCGRGACAKLSTCTHSECWVGGVWQGGYGWMLEVGCAVFWLWLADCTAARQCLRCAAHCQY